MPDDTTTQHRMSAEGADPLLFAGVNEANLQELQRTLGVRISFRGDAVTVTVRSSGTCATTRSLTDGVGSTS